MKVTYYKYWIEHKADRYLCDILPFLSAFCKVDNPKFKESFQDGEDHLFLYQMRQSVFMFIITKDKELIKTISAESSKPEDIAAKLEQGEHIGFASYIYFDSQYYFGIVNTIHGPKAKRFVEFMNKLLHAVSLSSCRFDCSPFADQADAQSAMKFGFKSGIRMSLKPTHPLFSALLSWAGSSDDVDSMVVEFRPRPRVEMRSTFDNVLKKVSDPGLASLVVRAKAELEDHLSDFYIVGTGHVSGPISGKNDQEICASILGNVSKNGVLRELATAHSQDDSYGVEGDPITSISRYHNPDSWGSHLVGHRE